VPKSLIVAAFAGLLITAVAAPAIAATAGKGLVLAKIDADHDGTISLDEAKGAAAVKFDALDIDKDGKLDAVELTGIVGRGGLAKADSDKDGTLDKAEYLALAEKLFAGADHGKSGALDAKELSSPKGRALVALLAY
jgi:Ca2+-binding EF-hand superfamily protein